ncbi:MAG TPA: hypothetical protein DD789_06715 [Firmicutes bacterium]|jgi:hypothetical protein|nr:hypothetical protein [Bacillota bacterium]
MPTEKWCVVKVLTLDGDIKVGINEFDLSDDGCPPIVYSFDSEGEAYSSSVAFSEISGIPLFTGADYFCDYAEV